MCATAGHIQEPTPNRARCLMILNMEISCLGKELRIQAFQIFTRDPRNYVPWHGPVDDNLVRPTAALPSMQERRRAI
jgi:hypothetical protein